MKPKTCILNFVNGNLSDARDQAKALSKVSLYRSMRRTFGWSHSKALATARYLKNPSQFTFDSACTAV
jgi:hypothetical protein